MKHRDLFALPVPVVNDFSVRHWSDRPHCEPGIEETKAKIVPKEAKVGYPFPRRGIVGGDIHLKQFHSCPGSLDQHFDLKGITFFTQLQVLDHGNGIGAKPALGIAQYLAGLYPQPEV